MGRKQSNNVDYFPCNCKDGKVVFILETHWGNDGFAFFYRLWKRIGDADFHYIDLRNDNNWEYFKAQMNVPEVLTEQILQKLADMDVIDPELWNERIIWSGSFVDDIADVWKKRGRDIPQKPLFLIQKTKYLSQKCEIGGISGTESTQSKVKESKVDKDIVEKESRPSNNIPYKAIISYLNEKANTHFKHDTPETKRLIKARWNQGFRVDAFKYVIDVKCEKWMCDDKMVSYLRPITLFGNKFEGYLNE